MAVYKYAPIDLEKKSFRLLRLLKGNLPDDIQCELFEGWINQPESGIPYNALSYTWGNTTELAKIKIDGNTMQVTLNLYTALQHLRLENQDQILWVDAICINQDNMQERTHQVRHMSKIYRHAEQVFVWLGCGTEETDFIMDFMKNLQENYIGTEGDWRRSAQLWINRLAVGQKSTNLISKWQRGMNSLLQRPWFRRIWILQEIANARFAILICGKKSISARTFAQIPSIIGLEPEPHCQAVLDVMPGLSRKESWWAQKRDLHTLLVKFRKSEATEERDNIYALLGMSSDAYESNILLPDYTKTLQQVIQDTTSFLLSPTSQDSSPYKFLDWSLPHFLNYIDNLGSAVLGIASEKGLKAVVKTLLATDGVRVDMMDYYGYTPLQRATKNGHKIIMQLLQEKSAPVKHLATREAQQNYSFLFVIDNIHANEDINNGGVGPLCDPDGHWTPPEQQTGFGRKAPGRMYRWSSGVVSAIEGYTRTDETWQDVNGGVLRVHQCVTMFYANHFNLFRIAEGDTTSYDMAMAPFPYNRWYPLNFDHNGSQSNVNISAEHNILAGGAGKTGNFVHKLGLEPYADRDDPHIPDTTALAGCLAIVIGLIAFTCSHQNLDNILLKDGAWRDYRWIGHTRDTGLRPQCGRVISIYYDPANGEYSNMSALRDLEYGDISLVQ